VIGMPVNIGESTPIGPCPEVKAFTTTICRS
jgi:hypothetical protein